MNFFHFSYYSGDWENAAKLQFIENQIKICEEIHSPSELEYWYTILGTHLAQHGTETRVQNVLDELLGSGLKFASNTIPEKILVNNICFLLSYSVIYSNQ